VDERTFGEMLINKRYFYFETLKWIYGDDVTNVGFKKINVFRCNKIRRLLNNLDVIQEIKKVIQDKSRSLNSALG